MIMKNNKYLILFSIPIFLLLLSSCGNVNKAETSSNPKSVVKNEKLNSIYEFELMDIKGKEHNLSQYTGKPLVIKFWASWCPICLASLDETEELSADRTKDYELITVVSPGYKNEKKTTDFIDWFSTLDSTKSTVLLDENGNFAKKLSVRAVPTYVYYDSHGEMIKAIPGYADKETIQNNIEDI